MLFKYTYLLFILMSGSTCLFGQTKSGTSFRSGFDRVGIYFEQTLNIEFKSNQLDLGLRYYGPDYFFEHNVVGMSFGYYHNFHVNKWYAGPGISGAFFHENKSSSEVYLSNLLLQGRCGFEISPRWSLFSVLGVGTIINKYTNYNINKTQSLMYVNYELAIGIKYYWRIPAES